jgi:hypothetical protein
MKRKISMTPAALVHEIERLTKATPSDLKERWRTLYGSEPPGRISRDLLVRALAYRIQEQALGGLKPSTRRLLAKVAADASARRPILLAPEPDLKPGTVLLREWHGIQHQVIFREDGITYKSLSQVAYRITGTKWPRAGLQLPARPARGLRGVHQEPGKRRLETHQDRIRRRRAVGRHHGAACAATSAR